MSQKKKIHLNDEEIMRLALKEARKGARRGEVPVGAAVARQGQIIALAHNRPMASSDPTAHAEILALRKAARQRKNYRLPDCDLFVTLEPCAMCLGAAVQARVRRIVYGAPDAKAGAISSVMRFPWERLNHRPEIEAGILAQEAAAILREFFRSKRKMKERSKFKRDGGGEGD